MKVVIFAGNGKYGEELNNNMTNNIINIVKKFTTNIEVLESDKEYDLKSLTTINDFFIGFSRGTKYLNKICDLNKDVFCVSIAGVNVKKDNGFNLRNPKDLVHKGKLDTLEYHFELTNHMKKELENKLSIIKNKQFINYINK